MALATLVHLLANMEVIHFEGDSHRLYLQLTILLVNFIIMLSFPLNFAIYCGMSAQFRNTFKSLFLCKFLAHRLNGSQSADAVDGNTVSLAIIGDGTSGAPVRRMSSVVGKTSRTKLNGHFSDHS